MVQGPAIGRACRHDLVKHKGDTASSALHLGQAGVEHLARGDHAHLFGHRLGRRNPLYDDTELMGLSLLQRLALAEDRIAPVDGEMQLVAGPPEAFGDLLSRPAGPVTRTVRSSYCT